MPLPLIRLSTSPVNGTAHHGVLTNAQAITACSAHSPDLLPVGENTAHTLCSGCTRALLVLMTEPDAGGEPEVRPSTGTGPGGAAHRPVPGHLLGYCGKPLDPNHPAPARRLCSSCARLGDALDRLRQHSGGILLPATEPCHGDDTLLWAPSGRDNLVVGHRRNSTTGKGFCERRLSGPNPGAPNECAPCRRHWKEAQRVRQEHILPLMRDEARTWLADSLGAFGDRASRLKPGDAYTLSGCAEIHHVVAVTDRAGESHTDLLVHLPVEDRVTDLRIQRDRLVTVRRPPRKRTARRRAG